MKMGSKGKRENRLKKKNKILAPPRQIRLKPNRPNLTVFKSANFEIGWKLWVPTHVRSSAENRKKTGKTTFRPVHFRQKWRFWINLTKTARNRKIAKHGLAFRHFWMKIHVFSTAFSRHLVLTKFWPKTETARKNVKTRKFRVCVKFSAEMWNTS